MLMRPSLNATNCSTGCNMELKEKLQPSSLNKTLFFAGMHQDQITSVLSIIRFARDSNLQFFLNSGMLY